MLRDHYKLFCPGQIGPLLLPNRLVRSATWDPSILKQRRMTDETLALYRRVAAGGVGLIITGDNSVVPAGMLEGVRPASQGASYDAVRIEGYSRLPEVVHRTAPECKIVAQVSVDCPGVCPSAIPSPFAGERPKPLSTEQVQMIVGCVIEATAGVKAEGFDGVQFHAAHGGLLGRFLSPYSNRRDDQYGGSVENRARIIREIVAGARQRVGDFPILIKVNGTDYVPGGIDLDSFPELTEQIESAGVDAIEVSGGMWECLVRSPEELGFRPVPAPESHTRLKKAERQSYFLPYAERLQLGIPLILVGGNRDVERLEAILQQGKVEFIALCRPLISEPELPNRWRTGQGSSGTDCISCNYCLAEMFAAVQEGKPRLVRCLFKEERQRVKEAQRWLSTWVRENTLVDGLEAWLRSEGLLPQASSHQGASDS
jgi:2,4-dienoyl-CoA reductase-like NADH-dependent reductase (Old Yellow Enzyme family)